MTIDELRARVATEVMGWTLEIVNSVDSFHWWCAPEGAICKAGDWRPDTDPRDRDMVVEAMERAGWYWSVVHDGEGTHAEFWQEIDMPLGDDQLPLIAMRGYASDPCLGIAIMRAALAAVEEVR